MVSFCFAYVNIRSRYTIGVKYVALLRGIGPGNPNMRNDKLRGVMEGLGFANVQSVISSGNLLFESDTADQKALEDMIEQAWPEKLGFMSTTIVRSEDQLQKFVAINPFGKLVHGPSSYLLVTFFKHPTKIRFELPYQPPGKVYQFISGSQTEICSSTDSTIVKTPDLMTWLEKEFGKDITSRTYKTVERILAKMRQV